MISSRQKNSKNQSNLEFSIQSQGELSPQFLNTFWGYFFGVPRVMICIGAPGSGKTLTMACAADIFLRLFEKGWVYWVLSTTNKAERFQKGLPPRMITTTDIMDPRITPPDEAIQDGSYVPHPKLVLIDEAGMELNQYHFGTDYDKIVTTWLKNHRHYDAWAILGDQDLAISKGPRGIGSGLVTFFAMTPMVIKNVKEKGGEQYKMVLKDYRLFEELNSYGLTTKQRFENGLATGKVINLDFFTSKKWIVKIRRPTWFTKEKSHIGRYMSREDVLSLSSPRKLQTQLGDLPVYEHTEIHQLFTELFDQRLDYNQKLEMDTVKGLFMQTTKRKPPPDYVIKEAYWWWLGERTSAPQQYDPDQKLRKRFAQAIQQFNIINNWHEYQKDVVILDARKHSLLVPSHIIRIVLLRLEADMTLHKLRKILGPLMRGDTLTKFNPVTKKTIQCWVFDYDKLKAQIHV